MSDNDQEYEYHSEEDEPAASDGDVGYEYHSGEDDAGGGEVPQAAWRGSQWATPLEGVPPTQEAAVPSPSARPASAPDLRWCLCALLPLQRSFHPHRR